MVAGDVGIGATIMGRNMFGLIRDRGTTTSGRAGGRLYHPRFVLTHHLRKCRSPWKADHLPLVMMASKRRSNAVDAAEERRQARRWAPTIQQYLLVFTRRCMSIRCRTGERLFDHLDGGPEGYDNVEFVCSPAVVHARLSRTTS
jgi:hypothetical protein